MKEMKHGVAHGKRRDKMTTNGVLQQLFRRHAWACRSCTASNVYFLLASIASPLLHATILIFGAGTISFDSILNDASFTMNVHTSSQSRYVCKWP